MGAVEHLKTLCCLRLKPESAMIAVTPLLHEIIPHGATRFALLEPDATIGCGYNENPASAALFQDRVRRYENLDEREVQRSTWISVAGASGLAPHLRPLL
jgi:hypothetical protein